MKAKKGISNTAWQRKSFKVKYPSNIVKKTLVDSNATLTPGKHYQYFSSEMQKTVLWESASLIRKVLSGLLT